MSGILFFLNACLKVASARLNFDAAVRILGGLGSLSTLRADFIAFLCVTFVFFNLLTGFL